MTVIYQVVVPDLGATGGQLTLSAWLVKTNDFVKAGSPVFAMKTARADMDVEAFRDGYILEILVVAGTRVTLGTVVAVMAGSLEEPLVGSSSPAATGMDNSDDDYRGALDRELEADIGAKACRGTDELVSTPGVDVVYVLTTTPSIPTRPWVTSLPKNSSSNLHLLERTLSVTHLLDEYTGSTCEGGRRMVFA